MNFIQSMISNRYKVIFIVFLLIGSFLRLYRLRDTMQFLGDQGRDALIARGILMERDPAFIGPVTSVGNMYLGPFYYYFMVLPLMFSYPDPVGPAYAVAIVGILTLGLLYILGKEMVGRSPALLAMGLYAVSPVIIENVRFSWNPNIVPLFSLLIIWCTWKTLRKEYRYWIGVGICAAILFQLHYITLILIGAVGLIWFYQLYTQFRAKQLNAVFVRSTLIAIAIFLVSLTPILLYDLKHDFLNMRAFAGFFTGQGQSNEAGHFRDFSDPSGIFYAWISLVVRNLVEIFGIKLNSSLLIVAFGVLLYLVMKTFVFSPRKGKTVLGKILIAYFFFIGVAIFALYKESIFNHYLGFLFPLSTLLLSLFLLRIWNSFMLKPLVLGTVIFLLINSIRMTPSQHILGMNVDVFKETAHQIEQRVGDSEHYDILLLSENNDFLGMNYRYFLTVGKNKPAKEEEVFEFKTLFVIDENQKENILDTPQYKIAIWPNRDILDDFSIPNGPRVVMLERE